MNESMKEKVSYEKVNYVSVWDGGDEVITSAKYNILTGEIFDIEPCSDEECEKLNQLEYEYIEDSNFKKQYVFVERSSSKRVTEKYILNILETYVHKFGSDKIELLYLDGTTDGDVVFVHYHDKHDSSNVNGEYFKVKSKESFEALDKMCKENGFDFEY